MSRPSLKLGTHSIIFTVILLVIIGWRIAALRLSYFVVRISYFGNVKKSRKICLPIKSRKKAAKHSIFMDNLVLG
jgi:hypothetical protein